MTKAILTSSAALAGAVLAAVAAPAIWPGLSRAEALEPASVYLVNSDAESVVVLGATVLTYKDGTVGVQVAVVYDAPQAFAEGEASMINYVYQYDCARGLGREKGSVLMDQAFSPVASNFEPAPWAASKPDSALGIAEAYACRREVDRLQALPARDVRGAATAHWAAKQAGG